MSQSKLSDFIELHGEKIGGRYVFVGTDVPLQRFLDYLDSNLNVSKFLEDFPAVRVEQVTNVLERVMRDEAGNHRLRTDEEIQRRNDRLKQIFERGSQKDAEWKVMSEAEREIELRSGRAMWFHIEDSLFGDSEVLRSAAQYIISQDLGTFAYFAIKRTDPILSEDENLETINSQPISLETINSQLINNGTFRWRIHHAHVQSHHNQTFRQLLQNIVSYARELSPKINAALVEDISLITVGQVFELIQQFSPELYEEILNVARDTPTDQISIIAIQNFLLRENENRKKFKALKQPKPEHSKLPYEIRQHTFQEARNLAIALTDGAELRNWSEIPGEVALKHHIEGQPIQTKLSADKSIDWWDKPASYELLKNELQNLTPQAVLLFHFLLQGVLSHKHAVLSLDDLIKELGETPRSVKERDALRREVYRQICLFASFKSYGQRRGMYTDPLTLKKDKIISEHSYFAITDRDFTEQQFRLDGSATPISVTLTASHWIEKHRENEQVLQYLGNARKFAGLPIGQPRGEWALCIGLTLNQLWREKTSRTEVKRTGENNTETQSFEFTREDLLTMFRPMRFKVEDILKSDRPKRAREYFAAAIDELNKRRVIGYHDHEKKSKIELPRIGWQEIWLQQKIEFRPFGDTKDDAIKIKKNADQAKRRMKAKSKTP